MTDMTIGQIARAAGVGVETIRFYQRQGLLAEPPKRSGYRRYGVDLVQRIQFIRSTKALGFALKEIRDLLSFRSSDLRTCGAVKQSAVKKLGEIDAKVEELMRVRAALAEITKTCSGTCSIDACTILDAFFGQGSPKPKRTTAARKT